LEIIGEAANRLPEDLKDKNEEIDWHKIIGLRNRIVHGYFGINYNIIWSIIEDYLVDLIAQIETLINTY
jgi:uncharacterized protein with HEPN domain